MASSAGKRKTRSSEKAAAPLEEDGDAFIQKIWEFQLPAECYDENGVVKVFLNCDEVRKSITNFLKNTAYKGVTKTKMLKLLDIEDADYDEFFKFGGIAIGVECKTYTAFFEFFEKMRVQEGEPKTKRRKQIDKGGGLFAEKGFYYAWKPKEAKKEEQDEEGGAQKKQKVENTSDKE